MAPERTQTPAQKELRKLCGGVPPQYVERQVLGILNRLIHDPQLIIASISDVADSPIFQCQRRELDALLRSPPVDEEQAKSSALALASFMLTSIGPEEYETCRLQRLFQGQQSMRELDAELLLLWEQIVQIIKNKAAEERTAADCRFSLCGLQKWKEVQKNGHYLV